MFGYKLTGIQIDKLYPPSTNVKSIPLNIEWSYTSKAVPQSYFDYTDNLVGNENRTLKILPSQTRREVWGKYFNEAAIDIEAKVEYSTINHYIWVETDLTEILDHIEQIEDAIETANMLYYADILDEYKIHIKKEEQKQAYREQARYINTILQNRKNQPK